jgi:hypothetical protein
MVQKNRKNKEKSERIEIQKLTSDSSRGPTKTSRKRRQEKSCKAKSDEPQDQDFFIVDEPSDLAFVS